MRRVYRPRLIVAALMLALTPTAALAERVACVGDSITLGTGTSGGNSYPVVLGRLLGPGQEVKNFGSSARTMIMAPAAGMPYWRAPEFGASKAYLPDVVVIMLGTNDSKTATWKGGSNTYEADSRALVAAYQALSSKPRVFLASSPPALTARSTITDAVISGEMPPILRRVAAAAGTGFIDVNGAFHPEPSKYFGTGDGKDIGDGIHPSNAGAMLIAQTVAQALKAMPALDAAGDVAGDAGGGQPGDASADAHFDVTGPIETPPPHPASPDTGTSFDLAPHAPADGAAERAPAPAEAPANTAAVASGLHCGYGDVESGRSGVRTLLLATIILASIVRALHFKARAAWPGHSRQESS
jgi:lysophospholipase L1-like esterase